MMMMRYENRIIFYRRFEGRILRVPPLICRLPGIIIESTMLFRFSRDFCDLPMRYRDVE